MTEDVDITMAEGEVDGISRRDAIKKGAVAGGALLWVTPIVQNVGLTHAFAQTTSPMCCSAAARAIRATFIGTVGGPGGTTVGTNPSPPSQGCLPVPPLTAPGSTAPFATADTACATTGVGAAGCSAETRIENFSADFTNVTAPGGAPGSGPFDVQVTADVLESEARCVCGGGCERTMTCANAVVTVAGQVISQGCTSTPGDKIDISNPLFTGFIVVNEQPAGTCVVNALRVFLEATPVNTLFAQTIELVVGHAEVTCS